MPGVIDLDAANILLDLLFGSGTPASFDIAILISAPVRDGTGFVEVTGAGYSRVSYTNNATNWPAAAGAVKKNATLIDFGTATADWGTDMYGIAFFAAGDIKAWAQFTTPQTVLNGNTFSIPPNAVVITA